MTIATRITVLRLASVPITLLFFFRRDRTGYEVAATLFAVAVISDVLDGYLARRLNQVTELGGMLDAVTDKILVHSLIFSFMSIGVINPLVAFPMFFRDMIVDGMRNKMSDLSTMYGANLWGKLKFCLQALSISLGFACCLSRNSLEFSFAANIVLAVALALSVAGLWKATHTLLSALSCGNSMIEKTARRYQIEGD